MNNLNPILFILLFILNITQISANGDDYYISFQNKAWTVPMVGEEYFTRSWTKYTRVGEYSIDDGSEYEEKNVDLTGTIANIQVTQSSLYSSNYPTLAIDTSTSYHWNSCSCTKNNPKPWFRLDLRKEYCIKEVRVRNRGDNGIGGWLKRRFQPRFLSFQLVHTRKFRNAHILEPFHSNFVVKELV